MTIFKKGDKSVCGNYRGISLLSIAGKILARILLNRLLPLTEDILSESQCGFRPSRGTTNMIFAAWLIQEKCREQRQGLFMAFIDLSNASDSVNCQALWKILSRFGCPPKFIQVLRLLHDGTATVLCKGSEAASFAICTGVKQGCVVAPTLFSIFLAVILILICDCLPSGIEIEYQMDSCLFNLRCLRSKSKVTRTAITNLQYADDCAILTHTEDILQTILDLFSSAYQNLGLSLNIRKTKVLHQPVPGVICPHP